jgi:hypothetical protein
MEDRESELEHSELSANSAQYALFALSEHPKISYIEWLISELENEENCGLKAMQLAVYERQISELTY